MVCGFNFELFEKIFTNCFIYSSKYSNGNLQLSLFGVDPDTDETAHFIDITLEQNYKRLKDNEIVVNCKYNNTFIPQLKKLGILKEQIGVIVLKNTMYPIYTIDFEKINQKQYYMRELLAA